MNSNAHQEKTGRMPDAPNPPPDAAGTALSRIAWIPIPLFLAAMVWGRYSGFHGYFEPPHLLPILNFTFQTAISLFIALLAARRYLVNRSLSLLLMGCGMVIFGSVSLISSVAVGLREVNMGVTIHNIGMALAGLCHFMAAAAGLIHGRPRPRTSEVLLLNAYFSAAAVLFLLTFAAHEGIIPTFFTQSAGPTLLRQTVLGMGVALFALAGAMLLVAHRRAGVAFLYWYGLSLGLIATGLFGVLIIHQVGSALGWLGRAAQYLGGVYMVIALAAAYRDTRSWLIPLENLLERTEAALLESEERFHALFNSMTEGFALHEIVTDAAGRPVDYRFLDINPAFERLTGLRREDVVDRLKSDVLPEDDPEWIALYGDVALRGVPLHMEKRSAALESWYEIYSYRPSPRRFAVIFMDITARKNVEQALRQTLEAMEQRVRERTAELEHRANQLARLASELTLAEHRERQRLAMVLHDHLQQLLAGANYRLQILGRSCDGNQAAMAEQVAEVIDEAIKVSRSLTVELAPPILHEAGLAAGIQWLARWMGEKHGLTVDLTVDPALSEMTEDEREDVRILLFQSAREALFNVVKHARVKSARMDLRGRLEDGTIYLVVADEGVGFDHVAQGHFPGPPGLADAGADGGSGAMADGFGLFTIAERLSLMGGRFLIDTAPGKGVRLEMIAPLGNGRARTEEAEAAAPPAAGDGNGNGSDGPPSGSHRIRVLLVDDHTLMRQGLGALLEIEEDMEVVAEASDGIEAVDQARQWVPDVILMDFSMPRMDGVAATRAIRKEMPDIRIVGLSMYEEAERAEAMMAAGANAYVAKSGPSDQLLSAIRAGRAGTGGGSVLKWSVKETAF